MPSRTLTLSREGSKPISLALAASLVEIFQAISLHPDKSHNQLTAVEHYLHSVITSIASKMAARSFSRALRPLARQVSTTQHRTFISAATYARTGLQAARKPTITTTLQQSRGLKQIDFAGTPETVYGMIIIVLHLAQKLTAL